MKDLTNAELDVLEKGLDRMGTPPDNVFRRMIAEIRRRRKVKR